MTEDCIPEGEVGTAYAARAAVNLCLTDSSAAFREWSATLALASARIARRSDEIGHVELELVTGAPMELQTFAEVFTVGAGVVGLLGGAYTLGYRKGRRELDNKTFTEIYAPLYGLFMDCYIVSCTSIGAPRLRQRVAIAKGQFKKGAHREAFLALFDRKESPRKAETEFGTTFPLAAITEHLKGREMYADRALIDLVMRANRAQYEERPDDGELTEFDALLLDHICKQHQRLGRKIGV